jgi:predicted MFS family arabinose efflux permease
MDESGNVENKEQSRQKPPLSLGRIIGEIFAGMASGLIVALPVAFVSGIGAIIASDEEVSCFGPALTLATSVCVLVIVLLMLYGPACAIGVYLVGRTGKQTGSFLAALGGGFLAGPVILVMLYLACHLSEAMMVMLFCLLLILALLISPILATLGFNLTCRYKDRKNING